MSLRLRRYPSSFAVLAVALGLSACHDGSESQPAPATNLGVATRLLVGSGQRWLVTVAEPDQGVDLTGDGDESDEVVHVLDLANGAARNTGLALAQPFGFTLGDIVPPILVGVGEGLVIGVSEADTGGMDRNGDGDANDAVLAVLDPTTGASLNLGLAARRIVMAGRTVAFDVSEFAQGSDLDGDGNVDPLTSVPHLHDLATGQTRNTALRGAQVLSGDDDFLAVAERESVVGDRNGDGDTLDFALGVFDLATDALTSAGLALGVFFGQPSTPLPHRGIWLVFVGEAAQGQGDLDGDGSATGSVLFALDPRTGDARLLPGFSPHYVPEVEPVVLFETRPPTFEAWFYDPVSDELESTGRVAGDALGFGDEVVLMVLEDREGEDLDGNGTTDGVVPFVLDPATGLERNTGISGGPLAVGPRLLVVSTESVALADWNADGDQDDHVLHVWDGRTGALTNTRVDTGLTTRCGSRAAFFLRTEAEEESDLNGDGDLLDQVAHLYDAEAGAVRNLGLAAMFLLVPSADEQGFLLVSEAGEGVDLDGDGDALDMVLHLVDPRL